MDKDIKTRGEGEGFYRAIFQAAGDALALLDPETGDILEANRKMDEMFGFPREGARGRRFWDLGAGESAGGAEGVRGLVRLAARGEPQLFEWEVQDSSGLHFWTEVHLKALAPAGKKRILAAVREITGRHQVRQALKESERRFRTVTEGSLAGVFILQEGRLVYANPMMGQIFGYPSEELARLSALHDLVLFPDRERAEENVGRLLKGELAWAHQVLRARRRDGGTLYCEVLLRRVDYQGRPAVIGTLLNVTARREMEEALRESERRYRAIVEDQTELVTRFLPDFTVTFANEANCHYFGKSREEMVGKSFLPFLPEEDRERVKQAISTLSPERPIVTLEHRVVKPDGQVPWQQWINRAIFDEKGSLVEYQGVGRDITRRRAMEEALRETRDHLETLIQASPLAIIVLDRSLQVRYWNPAAARIFGWSAEEVLGRGLPFVPPEELAESEALIRREMEGQHELGLELRRVRKDGSCAEVSLWTAPLKAANGEVVGIMGMLADITDRKRAEAALRESEEKYRALMESASDPILLVDTQGTVLEANQKTVDLLGYTKEELLTCHYTQLHPARMQEQIAREFEKAIETGTAMILDTLVLRKDGKEVPVDISGNVIEYAGKRVAQGIFHDITERKKAEGTLRRSEEKLRSLTTQLLTAQERERRRISRELHDELGQALTAMKIHLVTMEDKLGPERPDLKGDCEYLLGHIDEVIENVRRLSLDLSPTILEDLGLASALRHLLDEACRNNNMAGSLEMDEKINHLFPQETQSNIYRIFQEALTNVVRHARASRVTVAISRQDNSVAFAVEDDGQGFDVNETLSRRASRKRLGLTTMMERARMAGGSLSIHSHKGGGTRISFVLPLR